jgi:hypothetical protein
MLRKSEVCAIDFPIAAATLRPALAAGLKIGAAFETEDNRGRIFLFESAVTH